MDALQAKLQAVVEGKIVRLTVNVLCSAEFPHQDFEGQKQVEHVVHVTLVAATVGRARDRPIKILIFALGHIFSHWLRVAIITGHIRYLWNIDRVPNSRKWILCAHCYSG